MLPPMSPRTVKQLQILFRKKIEKRRRNFSFPVKIINIKFFQEKHDFTPTKKVVVLWKYTSKVKEGDYLRERHCIAGGKSL